MSAHAPGVLYITELVCPYIQTLDGGLLTVSLGAWMQLPNLSMESWEANHFANKQVSRSSIAWSAGHQLPGL